MYVCVCLAVTESEVREAIDDGAMTREAVTRACRAGGDCGACHGMISEMIEDKLDACAGFGAESRVEQTTCPMSSPDSREQLVPETALVRKSAA